MIWHTLDRWRPELMPKYWYKCQYASAQFSLLDLYPSFGGMVDQAFGD
jgi:hypothetical protein